MMKHTLLQPIAFLLTTLCLVSQLPAVAVAQASEPVNIAFLVADDLRADVASVYGGPVPTPNLERLAAQGSLFRRATCGYPICHVSRTEMLTGRSVVAEASAGKSIPFKAEWAIWPEVMRQAGWATVHCGKWHVEGTFAARGYLETSAMYSSGGAAGQPLTLSQTPTQRSVTGYTGWTFKAKDNRPLPEFGVGLTPQTDARIAAGAIEAIAERTKRPLFVHVNFTASHDPLFWPEGKENRFDPAQIALPSNFAARHPFDHGNIQGRDESIVPAPRTAEDVRRERAIYYAVVEQLDTQVGQILDAIDRAGGTWLVIFVSDQGMALGSHGLMGKQNQYEHTANTPCILAGPGIPAGQHIEAQCALRDLFPTACEITKLAIPASVQGKSLMPLIRGETPSLHELVFGYFTDSQRMVRTEDGWKLIWYPKLERTQLFHIPSDPNELTDLSSDAAHQPKRLQLLEQLKSWLRSQGDRLGET